MLLLHHYREASRNYTDSAGSSSRLLLSAAKRLLAQDHLRHATMLRVAVTRNAATILRRSAPPRVRVLSSETPAEAMEAKLRDQLDAVAVTVEDVSGGCGAMYKAYVESPRFVGLNIVKQHKLVQGVLKEEIAEMHGFTLKTAKPRGD